MDPDAAVERVFRELSSGRLGRDALTARAITALLGQSTMVLYHHFGSLEGFLIRVDGLGWKALLATLERHERRGAGLPDLAEAYVAFAFAHPDLYWLMAEHRFDREALARQGRLRLAASLPAAFQAVLARVGSRAPERDAPILLAGLHGLAALTLSGRAGLATGRGAAREAAIAAARDLATMLVERSPASKPAPPSPPRARAPRPRRRARLDSR